jgi:hypothetical protein
LKDEELKKGFGAHVKILGALNKKIKVKEVGIKF